MSSALMMSSNTTTTRLQNLLPRFSSSSRLPPKSLFFKSPGPALRRVYSSTTATGHPDSAMDAVQKRLMFEDEFVLFSPFTFNNLIYAVYIYLRNRLFVACRCILVDENDLVVGHDTKYNCT